MQNIIDFILAALPWICVGLFLAIFFAKSANKKKDNYSLEGMCFGLCLGTALGTSIGYTGIGITVGMLAGLVIGSLIEKKDNRNKK